jgi:hypothetical protein
VKPPMGTAPAAGNIFTFDRGANDAFIAVNRLLKAGKKVGANNRDFVAFTDASALSSLTPLGISFKPAVDVISSPLRAPRIGLWDQYGGSMESGWTRWILEQFEFPFTRVYAPELDAGSLNAKYDVLVFVSGAIPAVASAAGGGRGGRGGGGAGPDPQSIPEEYRAQLGRVTADKTIPQLKSFIENGGTVIALSDSAMNLAGQLGLPIQNHLVENGAPIPPAKFFVPGSVLTAKVDINEPLAFGMAERTDFFFDNSPVFKLGPDAAAANVRAFARFDSATPLHSGWAWGQKYLDGGVVAVEARVGKGRVVLYGAEILQRAQPHGTFKLLFNALFASVTP